MAGAMDRSIRLQQATETRDSRGGVLKVWPDATLTSVPRNVEVWAKVQPVRTDETFASAQLRGVELCDFGVRYRCDVTTAWRIVYGGKTYDILSIVEVGRREGLTLRGAHGMRA